MSRLGKLIEGKSEAYTASVWFVAHLIGDNGAKKYFKTGKDKKDAFGTKASSYEQLGKSCLGSK